MNIFILSLILALPALHYKTTPPHAHGIITVNRVESNIIKLDRGDLTIFVSNGEGLAWIEATTPKARAIIKTIQKQCVGMVKVELEVVYVGYHHSDKANRDLPIYDLIKIKKRKF